MDLHGLLKLIFFERVSLAVEGGDFLVECANGFFKSALPLVQLVSMFCEFRFHKLEFFDFVPDLCFLELEASFNSGHPFSVGFHKMIKLIFQQTGSPKHFRPKTRRNRCSYQRGGWRGTRRNKRVRKPRGRRQKCRFGFGNGLKRLKWLEKGLQ